MAFLTRQEKYIIAFLVTGALCGVSYSYYKKSHSPIDLRFREEVEQDNVLQKELDSLLKEAKTVNLNNAALEELIKLKGIGPALAHRIIEYRIQNGPFKDKSEIKKIPGIGPEKFNTIKDYIVVE